MPLSDGGDRASLQRSRTEREEFAMGSSSTSGASGYSEIVVGTDGSERAGIAFNEALKLSKLSGAKLHIVHAVSASANTGFVDVMGEGQVKAREARGQKDEIGMRLMEQADRADVTAELHNPEGDPAEGLLNVAEAVGADLIVVGNRGMTGASRFLLGSVPNKISHNATCSVLIVNTDRS
jgi:nucleotide-binding universal stress UspA family protein